MGANSDLQSAIGTIQDVITWLLILTPIGAGVRCAICAIKMAATPDDAVSLKKRIKHAIIFTIIAECLVGLIDVILAYYK